MKREEIKVITYVNSKDAKLFEDARQALHMDSLTLDQYLSNLSTLKAISPKYVRLPLYEDGHQDEEIFEIDANSRTIKVPASFSRNGVGVVSDELAETIWFKINRYFDIKDFGAAIENSDNLKDQELHILIQWEAPDGAKGASWAYAIDAEEDHPDHIYFGWALTAEHLMAKAGSIRFAIRIMQYDANGKIAYSFATQASQITVKAGLSFDVTDEGIEIENVADRIANRLMSGEIANCPVFGEDGDLPAYIINLEVPDGAAPGTEPQAVLEVVASAPIIKVDDIEHPGQKIEKQDTYDAMAYKWFKKGQGETEFTQIEGEYTPALTVTAAGEYYVVVFGMKKIVDSKEFTYDADAGTVSAEKEAFKFHTSVASTKSTVCVIPAPIKLNITEEMAAKLVIAEGATLILGIERQMIGEDAVGEVELRIEKTATAEKDLDLETAEFTVVGEPTEGSAAVEEAWIWNEVAYPTEAAAIEAKGESEGEIEHREAQDAVPATAGVTYLVDGGVVTIDMAKAAEGYYKVTVINKLNSVAEETESSVICRVVKPASIKEVTVTLISEQGSQGAGSIVFGDKIEATADLDGALSDELTYQWYVVSGHQDPTDESPDTLVEGAVGALFTPTAAGTYYVKAINKVEETEAIAISSAITFNN